MTDLFLKLLTMSLSASWLVLAVVILRLLLRKAPRWISCLLWALVAVRLICPLSIESALSLLPQKAGTGQIISEWTDDYVGDTWFFQEGSDSYDAAIEAGREPIAQEGGGSYVVTAPDQLSEPATVENTVVPVLSWIWLLGIAALGIGAVLSYYRLHKRVETAILLKDNIYQSEQVQSPFVLGILRPRIYLPFQMAEEDIAHVIAHEEAHIRRKDHWSKPFGFLLLMLYWFNPFMWLAYILFCRDMELACDERVVRELNPEERADYSQALLTCSMPHRTVTACPLAFGEIGVKERVQSVLNYKKPTAWLLSAGLLACVILAVCFLTNPKRETNFPLEPDTVTAAAEQAGLTWEITDKTWLYDEAGVASAEDGFRRYELHDPEQLRVPDYPLNSMLCATVESRREDGKKSLSLDFTCDALNWRNSYVWAPTFTSVNVPGNFMEHVQIMPSFEWGFWKKELVFAALLHGGFEDEEEVYRTFSQMEIPEDNGELSWYAEFPGAYFKVTRSEVAQEGEPWPTSYSVRVEIYESKAHCRKMEQEASEAMPEFPLKEETILEALKQTGLNGVISKEETTSQYSSDANQNVSYTLRDPEKKLNEESDFTILIGAVNSGFIGGSRQMSILLEPRSHVEEGAAEIPPFTWEEWKQEIIFATLLYGGFEDEEGVYRFLSELEIEDEAKGFKMGVPFSEGYCEVKKSAGNNGYGIRGEYVLWINFYESEEKYQLQMLENEEYRKKMEEFQQQRKEELQKKQKAEN